MKNMKPMEAVAALYSHGQEEVSEAIVASLSRVIFDEKGLAPATNVKRLLSRVSYRVLKLTTKSTVNDDGDNQAAATYKNPILDRSGHPYAQSLMGATSKATQTLVEGGDPMNSQYMMICPVIRGNSGVWDRLFLDSLQAKDVRLRMAWETLATYNAAKRLLDAGADVRLKAVAAGTGLSIILVYDRLVREGYAPARITVSISDRDEANIEKANRLMDKLATTKGRRAVQERGGSILAKPEDIFADHGDHGVDPYDVITAIGILEYFHGHTYTTTEERLNLGAPAESASALDLVLRLRELLALEGHLVVNSYRRNAATQLLEIFGRRFHYRTRADLSALMASAELQPLLLMGSGHVYDVEVYGRRPA